MHQACFTTVIRLGYKLPWLHFAAPVYNRDDMAYGAMPGCTQSSTDSAIPATGSVVSTLLVMALKYREVGFVFPVLQLCQCATDSRCDWLKLMEGGGVILDCTQAHTKLTRLSRCCLGLISKPVII